MSIELNAPAADDEQTFVFGCEGAPLVGVLHSPQVGNSDVGVVIVVGGPQYRVGSHRQFLLLARDLARKGFSTLRFDYRGMGDSDGVLLGFEHVEKDIRAAIDELMRRSPHVQKVILWGLCDGATAASFYSWQDSRVVGLVLLNPWVRSEQSLARSLFFHYYMQRFFNFAAWRKLLFEKSALKNAMRSFGSVAKSSFRKAKPQTVSPEVASNRHDSAPLASPGPIAPRFGAALSRFGGSILLVLSDTDITANEFVEAARTDRRLRKRLGAATVKRQRMEHADHTFSRKQWRDQVSEWTCTWLANDIR